MDAEQLKEQVKTVFLSNFGELINGASEDLQLYGEEIAHNMIEAAVSNDTEWEQELHAQAKALKGAYRLDVAEASMNSILQGISLGVGLLTALIPGIPTLNIPTGN